MTAAPELVTVGETMALLTAPEIGRLRDMHQLKLGAAGAESNVAIGVRRLGHSASWIGRVGDDELGRMILELLRREDVGVASARTDPAAPTALMFKERRTADVVRVTYYRQGLAGSRLTPDDVDADLVGGARILHLTGITPALGATARAATHHAVDLARAAGVPVSFDLNYRAALWSAEEAAAEYREILARCDLVFAGEDELELLDRHRGSVETAKEIAAGGAEVVVKQGEQGAVAVTAEAVVSAPAVPVAAIDPVGAGDAFVAGYLAALLDGDDVDTRLAQGCACGAFAVSVLGDWEGLPSRADLALLDHRAGTTLR